MIVLFLIVLFWGNLASSENVKTSELISDTSLSSEMHVSPKHLAIDVHNQDHQKELQSQTFANRKNEAPFNSNSNNTSEEYFDYPSFGKDSHEATTNTLEIIKLQSEKDKNLTDKLYSKFTSEKPVPTLFNQPSVEVTTEHLDEHSATLTYSEQTNDGEEGWLNTFTTTDADDKTAEEIFNSHINESTTIKPTDGNLNDILKMFFGETTIGDGVDQDTRRLNKLVNNIQSVTDSGERSSTYAENTYSPGKSEESTEVTTIKYPINIQNTKSYTNFPETPIEDVTELSYRRLKNNETDGNNETAHSRQIKTKLEEYATELNNTKLEKDENDNRYSEDKTLVHQDIVNNDEKFYKKNYQFFGAVLNDHGKICISFNVSMHLLLNETLMRLPIYYGTDSNCTENMGFITFYSGNTKENTNVTSEFSVRCERRSCFVDSIQITISDNQVNQQEIVALSSGLQLYPTKLGGTSISNNTEVLSFPDEDITVLLNNVSLYVSKDCFKAQAKFGPLIDYYKEILGSICALVVLVFVTIFTMKKILRREKNSFNTMM